ncbi:MAG: B12-binding domain-containing radical SAM protein, partial [Candidatus Odinarchaeota archaeon]
LLVHPAFKYAGKNHFPLGLGYAASYLRPFADKIIIHDEQRYQLGRPQLEQIRPDIIGVSSTTPAFKRTRALLKSIRSTPFSVRPLTIVGGVHGSFCPEEVLEAGADLVVRGESDLVIQQLFAGVNPYEIPGISFRESREVIHNDLPPLVEDLDTVPFPAREFFDPRLYPVMSLTTSRGCPYRCAYCSATVYWNNRVRFHSVEYVEKELEQISSLGYTSISFEDSTFTVDEKRTRQICTTLNENTELKKITWRCETRPDKINSGLVSEFELSRCILLNLGIETVSETILKANNRTVTVDRIQSTMELLNNSNVPVQVLLVFGLPGENEESIDETISFLKAFRPDRILLSLATVYPGTELWGKNRHFTLPLPWTRQFSGHGEFSQLYLPEGVSEARYKQLAEKLLLTCQQINSENNRRYRKKQKAVMDMTK